MPPARTHILGSPSMLHQFPPIHVLGNITNSGSDPNGFLPWLRRIRREKDLILEWSNSRRELQIWFWPVVNGQRVPPSELNALRLTHNFRGPSCLCAAQTSDPDRVTEAAIFLITTGRLAGEYAAACAQRKCKFWIFMERLYPRQGLPIRACVERVPGTPVPSAVEYAPVEDPADDLFMAPPSSQGSSSSSSTLSTPTRGGGPPYTQRPAKRARIGVRNTSTEENLDPFIVPDADPAPPSPHRTTPFGMLMELDRDHSCGLTIEQFRSLFSRCRRCRNLATKTAFRHHICKVLPEIIDLTGDSD